MRYPLTLLLLVLGLASPAAAGPSQQRNESLRHGLMMISACSSKGRFQDLESKPTVLHELLRKGTGAVLPLIELIADDTPTVAPAFCYWPSTTVGDVALALLSDLFTDPSGTVTLPGAGWDQILERKDKDKDTPAWDLVSRYVAKKGRAALRDKWGKLWVRNMERLIWDEASLCVRPTLPFSRDEEDAIREAVFRFQISNWDLNASAFCLSIRGKDPEKDFLKRFMGVTTPVKRGSGCREVREVVGWSIQDRKTGKFAVRFGSSGIRRLSASKAEVDATYSCSGLCAAGLTFTLEKTREGWTIRKTEIQFQS